MLVDLLPMLFVGDTYGGTYGVFFVRTRLPRSLPPFEFIVGSGSGENALSAGSVCVQGLCLDMDFEGVWVHLEV